ncbi:SDR family oxidoreductase [Salaquimonas pukyongi]|uniref:SDR family oxidoreductase n=1 Tax=Salaquimonas pukyongi TaxID=2712698 RepID=UPI00096B9127|nr:SDR family oxidoreductase [Salaquimonas pukyongi]
MTNLLITGVARGIGFELAQQALTMGWRVFGSVRSEEDAFRVQGELGVTGGGELRAAEAIEAPMGEAKAVPEARFTPLVFDVTDHAGVEAAADSIDMPIDILINNAGIIGPKRQTVLDMDFAGFAETLAVNTLAPLAVTQAFLPHLKRSDAGRIVTISSWMGSMSHQNADRIAYRASKSAINKVCQGLATELRGDGIAVISMHPGWVQTDMGGAAADIAPEESAAGILAVAENLTLSQTGHFINYDGSLLSW